MQTCITPLKAWLPILSEKVTKKSKDRTDGPVTCQQHVYCTLLN